MVSFTLVSKKIIENGYIRFNLFVGENNCGKAFRGKKRLIIIKYQIKIQIDTCQILM